MKKLVFIPIIILLIISGCLTYETAEIRITFNENSHTDGTIEVIYSNIRTSEAELTDQKKDFEELIGHYISDKFLLDNMADGVYVKERELFEKNGILIGKYSGIFRNFKFDNEPLKSSNEEYIILIDAESDGLVETNGKVVKSEKNIIISWPIDQKELYWKLKMTDGNEINPLVDMFRKWKEEQS